VSILVHTYVDGGEYCGNQMATKKKLSVKPTVAAMVIRPVATRLHRIEDLLIEMRGVLDFHLKRIAALQKQVDVLLEKNRVSPL
jgi:hypothetical protein